MSFKKRWQPNASQKAEYAERMRTIKSVQLEKLPSEYCQNCTGDVCTGDEIAFFNAGKESSRIFGKVIKDSYGSAKQQHTFTIEVNGEKMLIKGRNLYKNEVMRKLWPNELDRQKVIDEKHQRGNAARSIRAERKREDLYKIPNWVIPENDF